MGQAFWTGVRLPSSPPENKTALEKISSKAVFDLITFIINAYKLHIYQ